MLDGLVLSIDAMGGDNAPEIVIKGIEYFLKHEGKNRRARFLLHGDEAALAPLLAKAPSTIERSEIRHTEKRWKWMRSLLKLYVRAREQACGMRLQL